MAQRSRIATFAIALIIGVAFAGCMDDPEEAGGEPTPERVAIDGRAYTCDDREDGVCEEYEHDDDGQGDVASLESFGSEGGAVTIGNATYRCDDDDDGYCEEFELEQ